jgi:glutamate formiminotransferase/formiminotetrahydrofolate cyclodeaminase
MHTMEAAFEVFELAEAMVREGNPSSVSDAGVGALCARAAVHGAWLNVRINTSSLADMELAAAFLKKAEEIGKQADEWERRIMKLVEERM